MDSRFIYLSKITKEKGIGFALRIRQGLEGMKELGKATGKDSVFDFERFKIYLGENFWYSKNWSNT